MKYRVQTRAGINKTIEADSPTEAIKTLSDKKLIIKAVTGEEARFNSNVIVILLNGQRQSVGYYIVQPDVEAQKEQKQGINFETEKKSLILDAVCQTIIDMEASDFVSKALDLTNKEEIRENITSGYIPFRTKYGEMELDLVSGRVEWEGTSMGGNNDLYWKIQNIKEEIEERL